MKSDFIKLDLVQFDLLKELDILIEKKIVQWHNNQICFTTINDLNKVNDYTLGCGSLYREVSKNEATTIKIKMFEEKDFTKFVELFRATVFEDIYNYLICNYKIGRIRLMRSFPHTCLSWHYDDTERLHYVLKSNTKCRMVIEDQCLHMPQNTWWKVNTKKYHTAFNGSQQERIHLVSCLL